MGKVKQQDAEIKAAEQGGIEAPAGAIERAGQNGGGLAEPGTRAATRQAVVEAQQIGFDALFTEGLAQEVASPGEQEAGAVDKETLVGVPMIVVDWVTKPSDMADPTKGGHGMWARVHALMPWGQEVIFTDSSTGICASLLERDARGLHKRFPVRNGLRRSDFPADATKNRPAGSTYYFDNAPTKDEIKARIEAAKAMGGMKRAAITTANAARS